MLSIQDRQDRLPHLSRSLRRRALKIMAALDLEDVEISVLLCDDPTIQELNREWRGIDKPTRQYGSWGVVSFLRNGRNTSFVINHIIRAWSILFRLLG